MFLERRKYKNMTTQQTGAQGNQSQGQGQGQSQGQGQAPEAKPKTRLDILEERLAAIEEVVNEALKNMEGLKKQVGSVAAPKGLFGGKRERVAMKDTKTGVVYPSKAALGRALATEFGVDMDDHFSYYKVISAAPDRFAEAPEAEAKAAWDKVDAEKQALVDEANRKLAEEALAAKEPPKAGPASGPGLAPGQQPKTGPGPASGNQPQAKK